MKNSLISRMGVCLLSACLVSAVACKETPKENPKETTPATPDDKGKDAPNETAKAEAPKETTPEEEIKAPEPIDSAKVEALVKDWVKAQNDGDFDAYKASYADKFYGIKRVGPKTYKYDHDGWVKDRARMFKKKMQVIADDIDIQLVVGAMEQRGWRLLGVLEPPAIHLTVDVLSDEQLQNFLKDLEELGDTELVHACFVIVGLGSQGLMQAFGKPDGDHTGWFVTFRTIPLFHSQGCHHILDFSEFFRLLKGEKVFLVGEQTTSDTANTEDFPEKSDQIGGLQKQLLGNLQGFLLPVCIS